MVKLVRSFFLVETLLLLLFYFFGSIEYNGDVLLCIVVMALIDVVAIFYVQNRRGINIKYRLISTLFLIGYLIVFYQCYVDLLLGNIKADDGLFVSSQIIIKCCLLSTIGLSSFGFGYLRMKGAHNYVDKKNESAVVDLKIYRILFFVSFFIYLIFNLNKISNGSYSQEALEAEAGTMVLYSNMFLVIFYVLLVSYIIRNNYQMKGLTFGDYCNQFGRMSIICLSVYFIINVIIGDRGPAIISLSIFFGAYFFLSRGKLNIPILIGGLVIAVLLFSVLGQLRGEDSSGRFEKSAAVIREMNQSDVSIMPFTRELSSSVSTLHYSVYYVPDVHPYLYFILPLRYVATTIPFGDRLYFALFPMPKRYNSSAFFVTWLIQGDYYTYGNGTSCIADLYLCFGVIGVLFGMLLWGVFICYLERKGASGGLSINFIIIYLFTCGYAVYVNRAYLLIYMNYCVFAIIINFLINLATNKNK